MTSNEHPIPLALRILSRLSLGVIAGVLASFLVGAPLGVLAKLLHGVDNTDSSLTHLVLGLIVGLITGIASLLGFSRRKGLGRGLLLFLFLLVIIGPSLITGEWSLRGVDLSFSVLLFMNVFCRVIATHLTLDWMLEYFDEWAGSQLSVPKSRPPSLYAGQDPPTFRID